MNSLLFISYSPILCRANQDGASLRVHELLISLSPYYNITFICLSENLEPDYSYNFCNEYGVTSYYINSNFLYLKLLVLSFLPRKALRMLSSSPNFLVNRDSYVLYEGIYSLVFCPSLLFDHKSIVNLVDCHSLTYRRLLRYPTHSLFSFIRTVFFFVYYHFVEYFWSQKIDKSTTVSSDDATYLQRLNYKNIRVIPNGVDTSEYFFDSPYTDSIDYSILFYGRLSNLATADAALRLIDQFDQSRKYFPLYTLSIAGSDPTSALLSRISKSHVVFYDSPSDMRSIIYSHSIVVAIYSLNCGIKNTVLQALSTGRLCLVSPNIASAIGLQHLSHCIISSDLHSALQTLSTLSLEQKSDICRNGSQWVNDHFSWQSKSKLIIDTFID